MHQSASLHSPSHNHTHACSGSPTCHQAHACLLPVQTFKQIVISSCGGPLAEHTPTKAMGVDVWESVW